MRGLLIPLAASVLLAGCEETREAADAVARRTAKAGVVETLVTRFPNVPKVAVTPFTDCIIDNASAREIAIFAKSSAIGATEESVALVRTVLGRPETQTCVAREGLAALAAS